MQACPKSLRIAAALAAVFAAPSARADVRLHALFSDNMVLQQGVPAPVWGWAGEGETVSVSIQGVSATAKAIDGKWMAKLPPLQAGGPFEMTIEGKNKIVVGNVLVGEVWLCGGQSNMVWPVSNTLDSGQAIAQSANPNIRLFKTPQSGADEPQDNVEASWSECGPETVGSFSAVGYYFGQALQQARNTPVGLIQSCVGGTNVSSWIERSIMETTPEFRHYIEEYEKSLAAHPQALKAFEARKKEHQEAVVKAKAEGKPAPKAPQPPMGPDNMKRPGALYNAMIAPLQPYAIAGAIWYQGESNAGRPIQYREFFPAMIECWRKAWGQGDFPFLFVQLASYGPPAGHGWPLLREAQRMALDKVAKSGMAVAIDVGEKDNIHPQNKKPVGERLALAARAIAYGEAIEYSGPIYEAMEVRGAEIVLRFAHAASGLVAEGGELKGFEIAPEGGEFVPASARIEGDTVAVSSPAVAQPAAVRYAWASWPECNLFNREGLPASPFRTDDWDLGMQ